ncbi:MAG: hypothetical protein NW205_08280 [Hyphomicrobiaceae bacterium]|nr:hypothetical protein [Hyphomicrobiaceae bacterium]
MAETSDSAEPGGGRLAVPHQSTAGRLTWGGMFQWSALGAAGLVALCLALVLLMNPYGNLPTGIAARHVIMDINQRFQYPALARSGQFDSVVIGTSTARLLEPARLDRVLGGTWANLAMNDARAFEQSELFALYLRAVPAPRAVLVGLDSVWCREEADTDTTTRRGFPTWMYDDDPWNDWPNMLNTTTVDIAGRQAFYWLGAVPARVGHDGYEVFVPPESEYDAAKARQHIWGRRGGAIVPVDPPYQANTAERTGWRFPALTWLQERLESLPPTTLKLLVFMPVHVAKQPIPGSLPAAKEAECKERIDALARRFSAHLIDYRITSDLTRTDSNYWDGLHYRVGIAARVVDDLGGAVARGPAASDGTWLYRAGPMSHGG